MTAALFTLTSSLHSETVADAAREPFVQAVEQALGERFLYCGEDYSSFGTHDADIIYVRTGGTEGLFKSLGLSGDIKLMTSGESNSLAASMEILAYLRQQGRGGEILHGTPEQIAARIRFDASPCRCACEPITGKASQHQAAPAECCPQSFLKQLPAMDLEGIRLGVIGRPSDWLISSDVNYDQVRRKLNAVLIDIPMDRLLAKLRSSGKDLRSFEGSEAVYDALSELVQEYQLGGLTIRCFDLLDTVHNTGCLALARLNARGIPSSCEGDIPALLTMAWLQKERGCPGFQCNLSRIDGSRCLFAHCTVPLTMVSSYRYATHFESGIGTAIKGEIPAGEVEIVKISSDLNSCVRIPGRIICNCSEPNLCRTQIIVDAPGAAEYFLRAPLQNHHIISPITSSHHPSHQS